MKKLFILLLIVVSAASIFIVGCQKDLNTTVSTSTEGVKLIASPVQKPIQTFTELNAEVKVENGVLIFSSFNDFDRTINFLRDTSMKRDVKKQEIKKWEESLSPFISVYKTYEMAYQELVADSLNPKAIDVLKGKYSNKVRYLSDGMIEPLINNGNVFGRIISEKGMYKVGNSLIQYYDDQVISIPDGSLEKLDLAKRTLETDTSKAIYVHNLFLGQNKSNALQLRRTITPTCSNSCPAFFETAPTFSMNGETFRLTGKYNIVDNGGTFMGNVTRTVDVAVNINIFQSRKRWYGGFSASYSFGGFDWGYGWGFDLSIIAPDGVNGWAPPRSCCDEGIGKPAGGQGWHQDSELNHTIPLWKMSTANLTSDSQVIPFLFGSQRFCVRRVGLRSESSIVNSIDGSRPLFIDQYCQQ
jgi:hypothetical protein